MASATVDSADVRSKLHLLTGANLESLARRMVVSGGVIVRDEAKLRAPVGDGDYNESSWGSHAAGTLRDAIYLAQDKKATTGTRFTYAISWNAKLAPHGHLIEFGHLMPFKYGKYGGKYYSVVPEELKKNSKGGRNSKPGKGLGGKRIPAQPFLGPAYDAKLAVARDAMFARGKKEFEALLRGQDTGAAT